MRIAAVALLSSLHILLGCSALDWDGLTAGGPIEEPGAPCAADVEATALSRSTPDGERCYRRVHVGLPWGVADLRCQEDFGGKLAVIDDLEELDLHDALYPDDCAGVTGSCSGDPAQDSSRCDDRAWVGARFEEGEPVWIDGTPWTWPDSVWASGEPNERILPIALRTERLFDERPPDCPHPFICEIAPPVDP